MSKKEENKAEDVVKEEEEQLEADKVEVEVEVEEKKKEPTAEEQLESVKDQLLRTAAEYANYRARSAKEKEQTFSNAKSTVVAEILPSLDNLERAISADNSDYEALKKGVEMTLEGMMATLKKLGVEQFGEAGDSFDPQFHNAVMHVEDESLGENVITDVFQKGYKLGDRVIRPAMVKSAN